MPWKDFLDSLNIVPANAVAGFAGGLVNVFLFRNLAPIDFVGSIVVGAFTAVYAGKFVSDMTHMPVEMVCYFLGAGGQPVIAQLIAFFRRQIPGGTNANP